MSCDAPPQVVQARPPLPAGIYGPGRSLLSSSNAQTSGGGSRSGSNQRRAQTKFISRVHVHDAAQVLLGLLLSDLVPGMCMP